MVKRHVSSCLEACHLLRSARAAQIKLLFFARTVVPMTPRSCGNETMICITRSKVFLLPLKQSSRITRWWYFNREGRATEHCLDTKNRRRYTGSFWRFICVPDMPLG